MTITNEEQVRLACYHEAAHAVFVHDHPEMSLRYVEASLGPGDERQDITCHSVPRVSYSPHQPMGFAVFSLVARYAEFRALAPDDGRTGYMPFEEFMENADPDAMFPGLDEYGNPLQLLEERSRYVTREEEWGWYRDDYGGDDMDTLVQLRVAAGLARAFAGAAPSPEQLPGGTDWLRWRDLRTCYEDANQAASQFVGARWAEISMVAGRLMQAGHLDGSEVAHIIEEVREGER